jgi:hypothetical protein
VEVVKAFRGVNVGARLRLFSKREA